MAKKTADKKDFEKSLTELEQIVEKLEEGEVGLEEAMALYEKGVKLASGCNKALSASKRKIEVLTKKAEDEFSLEKFEEE